MQIPKIFLVETDLEASKTLFLHVFGASEMASSKARLLKHLFPVHGDFTGFLLAVAFVTPSDRGGDIGREAWTHESQWSGQQLHTTRATHTNGSVNRFRNEEVGVSQG